MDDSCAVCAETLEWVAYGSCGHREVCSTCVTRLRLVCDDKHCCICKFECDVVFVTKAMGDYTTVINDFTMFPRGGEVKEGMNGNYWYHEDTRAYFDDLEHYKMVQEMCRLSCIVCDNNEERMNANGGVKRRQKFKGIEQLKAHLFHQHKLFMCKLCLKGRKMFICEQNLYTKAQLQQHISTGDSEVDGTENERGGFKGHPICDFCKTPYYGDNELYRHMEHDHFNCFLCKRKNSGQYDYYNNYGDLEIHYRQQHFFCEDEKCLSEKFIVFATESELKRHALKMHDEKVSRSKRNSILQIPTSFQYAPISSNNYNRRRGGRVSLLDSSEDQLAHALQISMQTSSSNDHIHNHVERETDQITNSIESSSATDIEASSKYRQAVGQNSRNVPLDESSFPSLSSMAPMNTQSQPMQGQTTMAHQVSGRNKGKISVLNSVPARAASRGPASASNGFPPLVSSSASSGHLTATHSSPSWKYNALRQQNLQAKAPTKVNSSMLVSNFGDRGSIDLPVVKFPPVSATPKNLINNTDVRTSNNVIADNFPPIAVTQKKKSTTSPQQKLEVDDMYAKKNKVLTEKIRSALNFDDDKFKAFKIMTQEFRQGLIGTFEYISYIKQFGLTHLIFDLANLCPDNKKRLELIETYNLSVKSEKTPSKSSDKGKGKCVEESEDAFADRFTSVMSQKTQNKVSDKGKAKIVEESKNLSADNFISAVRNLQARNNKPPDEQVEVLTKDGYRDSNGKTTLNATVQQPDMRGSSLASVDLGKSKQKKTSKFIRIHLGDGSIETISDQRHLESGSEHGETANGDHNTNGGLPGIGVWQNGGGQKLAKSEKISKKG